ncbi:DegV domain-containing protein [Marmoricola endophyticus]|uniref:DegV domain-containing protein n=1 Tax=Marmoricola endophyticus TaxID=2040280 RepID=A0A917BE93_9ACTN|nr:DegV family protein [Marmoricola endophyticus]GGF37395.1 DegV domain-containing protein [Marmoricola endophyticus]
MLGLVTDSTASLSATTAADLGIEVVPLQVAIGSTTYPENAPGGTPDAIAEAMRAKVPVSTSRPSPEVLLATYDRLAAAGAEQIVSVHLSSQMSGTYESAQVAARRCSVPVTTLDTLQVGMSTGFAVLAGARVRDAGGDADAVAAAVRSRAASTTSLFYVDTLEHLRRGGRIGAASALLGSALSVKPILRVEHGLVCPLERQRTSTRALARLEELAVEAAGEDGTETPVDVAVFHLAAHERASEVAGALAARLSDQLEGRTPVLGELGAVLGAHVGPGTVAVSVSRRLG